MKKWLLCTIVGSVGGTANDVGILIGICHAIFSIILGIKNSAYVSVEWLE